MIRLLQEAVALAPASYQLHLGLAVAYGAAGRYPEAAESIRVGVALAAEGDPLVQSLRSLYDDDQLLTTHLMRLHEAVRAADPDSQDERLVEAFFLLGADRAQAAQAALQVLLAADGSDPVVKALHAVAEKNAQMGLRGTEPGPETPGPETPAPATPAPTPTPTPSPPARGDTPPPPTQYY
jgi:hypothetical protein